MTEPESENVVVHTRLGDQALTWYFKSSKTMVLGLGLLFERAQIGGLGLGTFQVHQVLKFFIKRHP